jgi:DNA-binding transcriptional MerR regulator
MGESKYTIRDLSELTGYSLRTIRYYVQEGLLEPPAGRGRGGFYFDSQLDQLRLIKSLQEKGMKLTSIIQYLKGKKVHKAEYAREVWVKYELIPGLEIHVSRDLEEKEGRMISEVIRTAKSIAKEDPEDGE